MPSRKNEISVPWPFAPDRVDLNQDTSLLKLIAIVTMFCDHAGKMLFPQYRVMRIIGRIAFPIYAYCIAAGMVYTRDSLKYLTRVVLLALISQPIYAVALDHTIPAMFSVSFREAPLRALWTFYLNSWNHPCILATLAVGICVIWTIRNRHLILTAGLLLLSWKISSGLDYGLRGVGLMVLFYLFVGKWWVSLPVMAAYMTWWGTLSGAYTLSAFGFTFSYGIQIYAILALIPIYIHTHTGIRINKWVFYSFYPLHLAAILLLDRFVF